MPNNRAPASPVLDSVVLHRIEPKVGAWRFYIVMLERNLFGHICVARSWGRVGTRGRAMSEPYESEAEATVEMRKLVVTKLKRGYAVL